MKRPCLEDSKNLLQRKETGVRKDTISCIVIRQRGSVHNINHKVHRYLMHSAVYAKDPQGTRMHKMIDLQKARKNYRPQEQALPQPGVVGFSTKVG
ncbi:hypothetical protein N7468_009301 [Penicillium chermesinum]|uniref:Uncharacterized protein n=1 Tax=Penicillium chermesinum TaxID=63820 RepID=A0A9W9TEQ1_9EURO|nr:uncharacterized protein N7468_009301 [Penicillium chermesinum]KAJ5220097.1 hypothetical protein N7468_009301 [Penicillium chermesinum]KAJ6157544.1 hypothetical protein N7470_005136 [Penicillium chermesinum]